MGTSDWDLSRARMEGPVGEAGFRLSEKSGMVDSRVGDWVNASGADIFFALQMI